ncbi:hypothetical protein DNHGIG_25480 [Collibacillus ludicampi]|uniref:Uncharacterized protein n=1 Tax=Collibacillus ludicampi TaxID=2771369 RepID=A0AAV4LH22_9BACL|nr:hypothetical protein [Collibacillus ludicampi]GIM46999.1 hypothetical protein DNHGIG_25480 [Collibacillus ludicampi]
MDVLTIILILLIAMLSGVAYTSGNYLVGICCLSFSAIFAIAMLAKPE